MSSKKENVIPLPQEQVASIQEWAARDAARVLVYCWEDAVVDGIEPAMLVNDIDEVCEILQAWKPKALAAMTKMKMEVKVGNQETEI